MLIDYYNQGVEEENKITIDDFEKYFGSTLLNVRKSPVDTTAEEVIIFFAMIGMIIIFIYNISIYIIKQKIKNYLKKNDYENELAKQLDDNVEEKHYRDMVILTKDFLVDLKSNGGFSTFKYSDVKWIHIHSVKYYGIITTSSSIIVHLNDGKTNIQCIKIKGGTTEEFLNIFNKICLSFFFSCFFALSVNTTLYFIYNPNSSFTSSIVYVLGFFLYSFIAFL